MGYIRSYILHDEIRNANNQMTEFNFFMNMCLLYLKKMHKIIKLQKKRGVGNFL